MNRLKELRKKNKTTQKELANLLGVSEMTISRWENSESVSLKHDKVQSLAEYFGVTVDYLLGYEELKTKHWTVIKRSKNFCLLILILKK